MAKMKKRRLRWKASDSRQAVGYRLYWAEGGEVGYDSPCVALGNVTEVILPDDVAGFAPNGGPIEFGIAAVDELGNESDLATFKATYQFSIPLAPEGLWIEPLDEFHSAEEEPHEETSLDPITLVNDGHESKVEKQASDAPGDKKDEDISYSSAALYQYPEDD